MMNKDFLSTVRFRFNGKTLYWKLNNVSNGFLLFSFFSLTGFVFERVWFIHSVPYVQFIRLLSAIWISFACFVATFFCQFFIIFHSSQLQSILLPAEWPCIFLVHLICLHFSFVIPISTIMFVMVLIHCQLPLSFFLAHSFSLCMFYWIPGKKSI